MIYLLNYLVSVQIFFKMNIGIAIKELRKLKGLSQIELARAANITQAALSQIENGKRPGEGTVKKISQALNISEAHLYIYGIEKKDVPENKRQIYEQLFPVIKDLLNKVVV